MDRATGAKFMLGLTKTLKETIKWEDGKEYPQCWVEMLSELHPAYTGKQKATQADGRVDRANKKYGADKK